MRALDIVSPSVVFVNFASEKLSGARKFYLKTCEVRTQIKFTRSTKIRPMFIRHIILHRQRNLRAAHFPSSDHRVSQAPHTNTIHRCGCVCVSDVHAIWHTFDAIHSEQLPTKWAKKKKIMQRGAHNNSCGDDVVCCECVCGLTRSTWSNRNTNVYEPK